VIELGRKIRERAAKPVKFPLRRVIIVHQDSTFLDDIQGE
jgi:isoleucyl-tRNA synthetase